MIISYILSHCKGFFCFFQETKIKTYIIEETRSNIRTSFL
ncbi:hypothetical protein ANACAC_03172 [Anaerostipes caccae L1-92]|uniref:Uncharacterized protein n=1 Tax=Anaerostipes caccae (strain DSM 14662 / CCUG 47493 / JCM 13470 / NCIMB 13811 / L1-92) TaxID=411490 RepID=B0MGT4_ANACD|nr:hypothetical protein ANACAC_03172 [Anaerostipes caccae L1-92]